MRERVRARIDGAGRGGGPHPHPQAAGPGRAPAKPPASPPPAPPATAGARGAAGPAAPARRAADTSRDAALARALQEELDAQAAAPPARPPAPAAAPPGRPVGPGTPCGVCGAPLGGGSAVLDPRAGRPVHRGCFRCSYCSEPIDGAYHRGRGAESAAVLHERCAREVYLPRCRVCGEGMEQFAEHGYWGDQYCPAHDRDGTAKCSACSRVAARGAGPPRRLDRQRAVCGECAATAVPDSAAAQPLYREVLAFYRRRGVPLPSEPPLTLVDEEALNDARPADPAAPPAHGHCRGMTFVELEQRVLRRPGRAPEPVGPPEAHVHAIMVLGGYPRLLTGQILAHELMHAWLKTSGALGLAPEVEEGLCEAMARLWLGEQRGSPAVRADPRQERLLGFLEWSQGANPDPVYGGGFRAAHRAVGRFGLRAVLDHVRLTGALPE